MVTTIKARDLTADHDNFMAELPMEAGVAKGRLEYSVIGEELVDVWLDSLGRITVRGDQDVHLREAS